MGLITGDGTVAVCPGGPLAGEVLEEQVAEGLAVVTYHLRVSGL